MKHNPHIEETYDVFLANNTKLILYVANRYRHRVKNTILDFDDLVQIAYIGFQQAYERYVPRMEINGEEVSIRFSTFAIPYMQGIILRHLQQYSTTIRYSRSIRDAGMQIMVAELDDKPIPVIQEKLGLTKETVVDALHYLKTSHLISLDLSPVDGEDTPYYNLISTYDDLSDLDFSSFFEKCTERDKSIIEGRLKGLTQVELAEQLGLSQVHVGRLLLKIQEKYHQYVQVVGG